MGGPFQRADGSFLGVAESFLGLDGAFQGADDPFLGANGSFLGVDDSFQGVNHPLSGRPAPPGSAAARHNLFNGKALEVICSEWPPGCDCATLLWHDSGAVVRFIACGTHPARIDRIVGAEARSNVWRYMMTNQ